jgi:hypothetical protein
MVMIFLLPIFVLSLGLSLEFSQLSVLLVLSNFRNSTLHNGRHICLLPGILLLLCPSGNKCKRFSVVFPPSCVLYGHTRLALFFSTFLVTLNVIPVYVYRVSFPILKTHVSRLVRLCH